MDPRSAFIAQWRFMRRLAAEQPTAMAVENVFNVVVFVTIYLLLRRRFGRVGSWLAAGFANSILANVRTLTGKTLFDHDRLMEIAAEEMGHSFYLENDDAAAS